MDNPMGKMTKPCKEWQGARNMTGYGQRKIGGKQLGVHRVTWEEAHGPVPKGLYVLHRCDNPPCYELEHLFLGTHKANMADRGAKGRHVHGERTHSAILTEAAVIEIRELYAGGDRQGTLATRYGVAEPTIGEIVRGETWKHVGGPRTFTGMGGYKR